MVELYWLVKYEPSKNINKTITMMITFGGILCAHILKSSLLAF